jgi:hypothetical protein
MTMRGHDIPIRVTANMVHAMRTVLVWLAVLACLAPAALTAADEFTTDKPSPLKLARRGNEEATIVRFTGSARISGRFLAAWEVMNQTPRYLRVVFLPDDASTRLLPHAVGSASVKELLLSNNETAARLLLGPQAESLLAKEVLFGGYRRERWFEAELANAGLREARGRAGGLLDGP